MRAVAEVMLIKVLCKIFMALNDDEIVLQVGLFIDHDVYYYAYAHKAYKSLCFSRSKPRHFSNFRILIILV